MKYKIRFFGKEFNLPWLRHLFKTIQSFSFTEKTIFVIFGILFVISSLLMLLKVNTNLLVEVPRFGGVLKEGLVGTPRFINPLLAISETDRDLTTLIYSGLMRIDANGNLIPDLALEYEESEDGLEYTFTIRGDAVFHDGEPVTADDVIFTINKAINPTIKSPERSNWDGIMIEKISEQEILFVLPKTYSPFLSNMTLGILPEHIWKEVSDEEFPFTQRNVDPVGSGPYKISKIKRNSSGIAVSYELESFKNFTLGRPHIEKIIFNFYKNENDLLVALDNGNIDSVNGISPNFAKQLEEKNNILRIPLPRIFGVFFNQSQASILASKTVREALETAIDKGEIIEEILYGYGNEADSPIPVGLIPVETLEIKKEEESETSSTEQALEILINAGFEMNEDGIMQRELDNGIETLSLTLSTADVSELVSVAEKVVNYWKAIGVDVTLKIFDPNDFNQNIVRPRQYDAILFGEVIGRDLDFYAFWHSSQRNDPGLNIADYANIDVDAALEKARISENNSDKIEKLKIFVREIKKDIPAIFIYSPDFIYIVPENLNENIPKNLTMPSERFLSVYNWYTETDSVWKFFHKDI
jgi:peptide/nickel transport system substrate-binding protein